ncbi:hypothetical protein DVS28_b0177 (plasmid) [Euzebya pacifica]|uniref:Uncharacterized protein n=1 Tax=Euzebya pacifica TaxID=1608957 RepID=A0A346Y650_9ACTN|nr:hypothetical protein [Euzebya pacifica]AXV09947.1 hypothetical protein DVS28_b0177 [Euzebya pacifica]
MTATATLTVPAELIGALRTVLGLAHTDVSDGLRDWGQQDCLDCGADDEPCEDHIGDHDLVADIGALLGLLPAETNPATTAVVTATVALNVTIDLENAMPSGVTGQATDAEQGTARWLVASLLGVLGTPGGRITNIDVTTDTTTTLDAAAAVPFAEYVRDLLTLTDECDAPGDHLEWIHSDLFSRARAIWGPRRIVADATVEVALAADQLKRLNGSDFIAGAARDLGGTVTVDVRRIDLH